MKRLLTTPVTLPLWLFAIVIGLELIQSAIHLIESHGTLGLGLLTGAVAVGWLIPTIVRRTRSRHTA